MKNWQAIKNWLIVHCAEEIKAITSVIMLLTAGFMIYDRVIDNSILPPFFELTNFDWWAWVSALTIFGVGQLVMLKYVDCYRCRIVADLALQTSGILLICIGMAFAHEYPPAHILMVAYPVWGFGVLIAGKYMGRRSRTRFKDYNNDANAI